MKADPAASVSAHGGHRQNGHGDRLQRNGAPPPVLGSLWRVYITRFQEGVSLINERRGAHVVMLQTSHENHKAGGQGTPGRGVCNRAWDQR